jgi:hypothetical protein
MSAQKILWKIYFPRCITTKKIDKMFQHFSSHAVTNRSPSSKEG